MELIRGGTEMNYSPDSRTALIDNSNTDSENNTSIKILNYDILFSFSNYGSVTRLHANTFSCQRRGGKGVSFKRSHTGDFIENLFTTFENTAHVCFTSFGRIFWLHTNMFLENSLNDVDIEIEKLLLLKNQEKVISLIPIPSSTKDFYIMIATKHGLVQRTKFSEFPLLNINGLYAMKLKESDELISATFTNGIQDILLVTKHGMSIRFSEKDIHETKIYTSGKHSISLSNDDVVIGMTAIEDDSDLLVVSEKGFGKRTSLDEYRLQSRSGKGCSTYRVAQKTGPLVGVTLINDTKDIFLINDEGNIIRLEALEIPVLSRETQGVNLIETRN